MLFGKGQSFLNSLTFFGLYLYFLTVLSDYSPETFELFTPNSSLAIVYTFILFAMIMIDAKKGWVFKFGALSSEDKAKIKKEMWFTTPLSVFAFLKLLPILSPIYGYTFSREMPFYEDASQASLYLFTFSMIMYLGTRFSFNKTKEVTE